MDDLDPNSLATALPAYLSTPISLLEAIQLGPTDPEGLSAYLAYAQYGNYQYCSTLGHGAHYCGVSVTAVGPFFGMCLPSNCTHDEFATLAGPCMVSRATRNAGLAKAFANITVNSSSVTAFVNAIGAGIPDARVDAWGLYQGLLMVDSLTKRAGEGWKDAVAGGVSLGTFQVVPGYCDNFESSMSGDGTACVVILSLLLLCVVFASLIGMKLEFNTYKTEGLPEITPDASFDQIFLQVTPTAL